MISIHSVEQLIKQTDEIYYSLQGTESIGEIINKISTDICYERLTVEEKVEISRHILNRLSIEERMCLAEEFLKEQLIEQRKNLMKLGFVTAQPVQIDSGYIAQHLVSLLTQIPGQAMRGKGLDLDDGSEVKSANFLASLDKNNQTSPRWNFTANSMEDIQKTLSYKHVYLVSIDLNIDSLFRIRIWRTNFNNNPLLKARYDEWVQSLAIPKFTNNKRQSVNFQLFPPHSKSNENYARHGNGRAFSKLSIPLEDNIHSQLIFEANETKEGTIEISFH